MDEIEAALRALISQEQELARLKLVLVEQAGNHDVTSHFEKILKDSSEATLQSYRQLIGVLLSTKMRNRFLRDLAKKSRPTKGPKFSMLTDWILQQKQDWSAGRLLIELQKMSRADRRKNIGHADLPSERTISTAKKTCSKKREI